jgi:hypothetical protein
MPRIRRDPEDCFVDDVVDGWRVGADEPDRLLRLSAGVLLPGRGWLEFQVDPLDGGARSLIRQTATFDPKGIAGRLYWYGVLPLHALVFRGLLRRLAQRAVRNTAPADLARFTYSSVVGAPAADVFRWHEQPGALAALTPAALVRIEERDGGIRDGGRVTVSIGLGPARLRWSVRHYGYIDGRRFCDEQVAGPFAVWRHVHLFESLGPSWTDALRGPHRVRRRAPPGRESSRCSRPQAAASDRLCTPAPRCPDGRRQRPPAPGASMGGPVMLSTSRAARTSTPFIRSRGSMPPSAEQACASDSLMHVLAMP